MRGGLPDRRRCTGARTGSSTSTRRICIGCKACIAACPYDAIFMNPEDNSAEKCNLCAHRLEVGLERACVTVCPTQAILVGDLNDPDSRVAEIVNREPVTVRRPEKGTRPGLFYKGAHSATLDPLAARRPDGGLFAWATQGGEHDPGHVTGGHPGGPTPARRRCCPTTWATMRRGAGGSACTRGPRAWRLAACWSR